ncbi:MAG: MaoC family dehydratase [Paracoccaceae bacterium]|nr:MaoC family dehydratase [Paracoccaceae bacterium]
MYFDDLPVGFAFETGSRSLSEDEILSFARQYDKQPFHTDPEAAKASAYGGLIASGLQTMAIGFDLTLEVGIWNEASMGSPGMDQVRWIRPVRPGDTLRVKAVVVSSKPSRSRDDRGRTGIMYRVLNQVDEVVMTYQIIHILKRRPV